jgi:hypothetical protein
MRIKGAMTILTKEAKFLGMTVDEVVDFIDNSNHYTVPVKVLQAYEVYKMDQGYRWSGVNFERWVKKETV